MSVSTGSTDIGPFSITPRWVRDECKGQPWAMMLYACLADHADRNSDNGWTIGREALADEIGTSAATIDRAVKHLVSFGALEVVRNRLGKEWGWSRYVVRTVKSSQVGQVSSPVSTPVITGGTGVITSDDVSKEPPIKTPLAPSEKPKASEPGELTANQLAKKLVDDYWAYVKAQTGKHPVGITWKAMRAIVAPFFEAGYSTAQLKKAMLEIRTEGKTFTRQVIEQHLDGRVRKRPAASGVQAAADVDTKVRDEFEQAVIDGDEARAWAMFCQKAEARNDKRWFAEVAEALASGTPNSSILRMVRHADGQPVTAADIGEVIQAHNQVVAQCRARSPSPPALQRQSTPTLKGPSQ